MLDVLDVLDVWMCWMCVYLGVGHNETMRAYFMQYLLISLLDALASYDYRLGFGVCTWKV